MKIAISTESTVDLTEDLIKKHNVHIVPFTILLGDKVLLDGQFPTEEIFSYVKETKTLPKTSAVNEHQFNEHFKKILETHDAIIHISLSSEMSLAYNNAVAASHAFKNVHIIDSRSLSTGIALLVIYADELRSKNKPLAEIVKLVEERKKHLQVSFVLDRLDYLHKGGRCSSLQLLGANLLKLHPEILVEDGKMDAGKKFRGNLKTVIEKYCESILEKFNTPNLDHVFITTTVMAEELKQVAYDIVKAKGFKNIYKTIAGGTISSHCGENCLGILYINDGKQKI